MENFGLAPDGGQTNTSAPQSNSNQPTTSDPHSNTPVPTFVETAPDNPSRSRPLPRYNRLQVANTRGRRNRQGPPRTPLQSLAYFLEQCRRRRLAIRAPTATSQQQRPLGVCAVKPKPLVSLDKREIVGLPSLFEVGLLAELTDEDDFLGPMKRAILDNDVQSFSKQGVYISQFWPIGSVVDNCILIDNKLAIPFKLRSAILTRLHRSHPGQQAMIDVAEFIWWPYMKPQIVEKCQGCMECTKFSKNMKSSQTFNSSLLLPPLVAPNEELQLDFAGPLQDEKGKKVFILVAVDRFSKFPSALLTKNTGSKKVIKFLEAYIRMYGIPKSIRPDHGSGFKSALVMEFCENLGIDHILCPVSDHRGCGLVERTIQTIKRKLGTEAFNPQYKGLNSVLHTILDDLQQFKHATLKKFFFEIHFGRKPYTEFSLARDKILANASDQSSLARSLLKPEDRHSQDYSLDRVKVVKRGSHSPDVPLRFKKIVRGQKIADTKQYKALEELARAANRWSQLKRNINVETGRSQMRELGSRNTEIANAFKNRP